MKGPREIRRYSQRYRKWLKAVRWDDLMIFKGDRCKKWRKVKRRPRDGYGRRLETIE